MTRMTATHSSSQDDLQSPAQSQAKAKAQQQQLQHTDNVVSGEPQHEPMPLQIDVIATDSDHSTSAFVPETPPSQSDAIDTDAVVGAAPVINADVAVAPLKKRSASTVSKQKSTAKPKKRAKRAVSTSANPHAPCVGLYVDALDTKMRWAEAQIVDCNVGEHKLKVHFIGWGPKYDIWTDKFSLAAHGAFFPITKKARAHPRRWDGHWDLFSDGTDAVEATATATATSNAPVIAITTATAARNASVPLSSHQVDLPAAALRKVQCTKAKPELLNERKRSKAKATDVVADTAATTDRKAMTEGKATKTTRMLQMKREQMLQLKRERQRERRALAKAEGAVNAPVTAAPTVKTNKPNTAIVNRTTNKKQRSSSALTTAAATVEAASVAIRTSNKDDDDNKRKSKSKSKSKSSLKRSAAAAAALPRASKAKPKRRLRDVPLALVPADGTQAVDFVAIRQAFTADAAQTTQFLQHCAGVWQQQWRSIARDVASSSS